jgi:F0F1-type ATP synthase assembly protein I
MSAPSSQPGVDRVTEPKQPDRTLGELFGDLGSELGALVRSELDLAKTEARQEVRRASQAGAAFATAAIAGLLTLLFLSSALAWLLDQWINRALSFLIVAVLWGIVAMVGVRAGRARARSIEPVPQTVNTLKEDVQWIKQQKS